MSKVRFELSMSLDGYVTAANPTPEEPMGPGGQVLHDRAFGADDAGLDVLGDSEVSVGANITGRRTSDTSIQYWGAAGPAREQRTPTFIVSHSEPDDVPEHGVYTFVSSAEAALDAAIAVAGDKDVSVFSASIGQQMLAAGRIDEIRIHLVPVLLGNGTRLIDDLDGHHIRLERLGTLESAMATHLRHSVVNAS